MAEKCVLVTGGSGFIGSHTVIELYKAGYTAVVVDNLINSVEESINRVREIVGQNFPFYKVDIQDKDGLIEIFQKHSFICVIHFAGLKAVGESAEKPLKYYKNNITGTITLLEVMEQFNQQSLIFSSSATVYGNPQYLPLDEKHPVGACTNPYGKTKYFIENILQDMAAANDKWQFTLLRYFNPIGAHESGKIGEDPQGPPNNLMPYVAQVAIGKRPFLRVFGNDYDTKDGTGVRDYIHVVDLAQGHVKALNQLSSGCKVYNLGTGQGYSVLDMVEALEKVSQRKIKYEIHERRSGDVANVCADPSLSEKELGWKTKKDLNDMCKDLWNWQSQNPNGFRSE
ncbi:DgyrCDS4240 [Dimorphilus gyrociliatus]|uniref:UDP-glucose 4-epimerase n=1 Tax=Dimorphilus gyrociliatus TaxID=2664684 RepID=A0A7I8VIZ8_9ANNE|nr:DgyrCDS4240 [Dimorphilus gyrociliatus]